MQSTRRPRTALQIATAIVKAHPEAALEVLREMSRRATHMRMMTVAAGQACK